jgi:hypothetical protein
MTTSGTTSYNLTSGEIVEAAFNALGIGMEGEALTARMAADGQRMLNLMIKTWGAQEHLWTKTEGTMAMVSGQASYALTNPRPMRVLSVRRRQNGIDTPLNEFSRQEYFDQPNKTTSPSIPVSFYFDPQAGEGTLYLWPAPSAQTVTDFTIHLTYLRRMDDMTASNNDADFPQEWLEPLVWNLAKRLLTQYPVNDSNQMQMVLSMAAETFDALSGWDNETASIYLQPERTWC